MSKKNNGSASGCLTIIVICVIISMITTIISAAAPFLPLLLVVALIVIVVYFVLNKKKLDKSKDELQNILNYYVEMLIYSSNDKMMTYPSVKIVERDLIRLNAGMKTAKTSEAVFHLWNNIQYSKLAIEFFNHSDLMKMKENIESATSDRQYKIQTLYNQYKEFYINDFSKQINSTIEFENIIIFVNNKLTYEANAEYYSNLLLPLIEAFPIKADSPVGIMVILDSAELREKASAKNYANGVNASLYIAMSKLLSKNYNMRQMLELVINAPTTILLLNRNQEKYELKQEQERLLNGDMRYEINREILKLSLDSVKTGIDFENYLKSIFEKLGYIASTTKGSGDRGADLILERNNIKYIIQAKFYSQPVGNKSIQEAHTAKEIYKGNVAAVITNNSFTKQAIEDAKSTNVVLVDGEKLKILVAFLAENKFIDIFTI